jgi:lysophospholipid acyltransferase (LPLAT)-like uncharacterized protein
MIPEQSQQAGSKARRSRVVVPHVLPWHKRLLARVGCVLMHTLSLTLRYRLLDRSGLFTGGLSGPVIVCLWHNRLGSAPTFYRRYFRKQASTRRAAAIVSASRDGALLAYFLQLVGMQSARGSTSRRGPMAMLEMARLATQGYTLAITPDGPRGPCYHLQSGVIYLARLTQLPIVPCSMNTGWKVCLKSWDRFQVPLPFSRVTVEFAPPLSVPRDASEADQASLLEDLRERMRSITRD